VKQLRLLPILIGMLLSGVPLRAQQADFRPDYGMLNGRRYMNGYFGFSYRFPEGWTGSALRYPAVGESKMYPLFSANPQAASTSDVRYVSINADYLAPNSTAKTPKDFLEIALSQQAGPLGEFEALHTDKRYLFGGRQFYRVDMRAKPSPGSPVFYQTLICIILRNYAITFSFMAANDDDLEDLVRTMESLTFVEPGQMATPQTMVAGQQQAPAASSPVAARAPSTLVPATAESRPTEPAALPESASAQPAETSSPARTTPPPAKTTRRATATVSSPASEVPTAEIPLNQVATSMPVVEAEAVSPVPSATITPSAPMATNTLGSGTAPSLPPPAEISSARNTSAPASSGTTTVTSMPSRSAAPSTLIPMGRAPQSAYPTTEPTARVQPANTTAPSTQLVRPETTAAPPVSPPVQPTQETVNPPTASADNSAANVKLQPATELAANQPSVQPAVERAPVQPTPVPTPVTVATATPPAASASKTTALTRIYVPPSELDQYILRKTPPVYPMIAKAAGVGGMVVLDIIVDSKGNLQKVTTVNGSALLARAAEEALRQWRFKPYLIDGNPVEMESQVAMNFRLTR
jgi:protein TonB